MNTIRIKGPGLNSYFAEQMVNDLGPEEAMKRSCGPMLEAVEHVIAARKASTQQEIVTELATIPALQAERVQ